MLAALVLLAFFAAVGAVSVAAQWPADSPPTTPQAQRSALNSVRSQVTWLQNRTRTAPNLGQQGYDALWRSFQDLRHSFVALKQTLTPQQAAQGANDLAELNVGLDIVEEAFDNYREDVSAGRPASPAFGVLCRVLRQGSTLWVQRLNKTSLRLRIGWR